MNIEIIKRDVYYYLGRRPTVQEAEEIMDFCEQHPFTPLDEIISDYYGC